MKSPSTLNSRLAFCLSILLLSSPLAQTIAKAQQTAPPQSTAEVSPDASQFMRLERIEVAGGGELITVHAKLVGVPSEKEDQWVPLVSILKDTLGDQNTDNDRLRYIWPLTYTRPTIKQRVAAAIPFFYSRIENKSNVSAGPPPAAFDFAAPESLVWDKIFWAALQNVLFDPYSLAIKASTSSYRRNVSDYRKSHIIRAISVLTLYQAVSGQSEFSETEMAQMQARLMLTDKMFGGIVDDSNLQRYYERQSTAIKDARGHNWELLRQQAEAASLHFEPLMMPDGSATHALVWVAKSDLLKLKGTKYHGRFLNIANPWDDKRLLNWDGYTESRYFDQDNRPVEKDAPGARAVELIPLALYGLDNPRIPMLLVDFRDGYNPKKREMSRRVLNDVTRNLLSLSKFGNLPYFLGRTVFDFVTGRRGMQAFAARLGGETISFLTFTGPLLGEATKVALLRKRVPLTYGVPALVVDNLLYNLSVVFFVMSGACVMLVSYHLPPPVYWVLLSIALIAGLGIVATALAAKNRVMLLTWVIDQLAELRLSPKVILKRRHHISHLETKVYDFYKHHPGAFFGMIGCNLLAHISSVIEVYLALRMSETR